jgi:hypothetical protein
MTSARQFMSSKRWFNDLRKVLQNLETCLEDVDAKPAQCTGEQLRLSDGRFQVRSRMSASGSSSMSKATTNALRSCFSFASDSAPI